MSTGNKANDGTDMRTNLIFLCPTPQSHDCIQEEKAKCKWETMPTCDIPETNGGHESRRHGKSLSPLLRYNTLSPP